MSLNAFAVLPKRGTAARWAAENVLLGVGEVGFETDTKKEKRGDGVTAWNDLPYTTDNLVAGRTTGGVVLVVGPTLPTLPSGTPYKWDQVDAATGTWLNTFTGVAP